MQPTTESDRDDAVSQQGHYAGAATRLAAFAIDQTVLTTAFAGVQRCSHG